jgi:hypothetical protein
MSSAVVFIHFQEIFVKIGRQKSINQKLLINQDYRNEKNFRQ